MITLTKLIKPIELMKFMKLIISAVIILILKDQTILLNKLK